MGELADRYRKVLKILCKQLYGHEDLSKAWVYAPYIPLQVSGPIEQPKEPPMEQDGWIEIEKGLWVNAVEWERHEYYRKRRAESKRYMDELKRLEELDLRKQQERQLSPFFDSI